MVIPHNHDRIFSLHLSSLMILFLSGTVLLMITLAGYGYYHRRKVELELTHLKTLYGVNYTQANKLYRQTVVTEDLHENLQDNLIEIAHMAGLSHEEIKMMENQEDHSMDNARKMLREEVLRRSDMVTGTNYMPSIYTVKAETLALNDQFPLLNFVHESIAIGLGIYAGMPTGRPFPTLAGLHDTSMFGLRLDPLSRVNLEFHTGMDTAGPEGTPVYATASGTVSRITHMDPGYGNSVTLTHKNGFSSLFGHFSRVKVHSGEKVRKGTLIGYMGHTGRVTGDHLHYEVMLGSTRVDPLPYVCSTDLKSARCKQFYRDEDD